MFVNYRTIFVETDTTECATKQTTHCSGTPLERLGFSWHSGIENHREKQKLFFISEALMFELVLSVATYALSESNIGCDACVSGNFPEASRQFSKTAGIFQYLSEDLLPNWMAKSKQHAEMEKESLAETRVGVCVAFTSLYMAMSQQMAVATILIKPGVPNYSLVGKLCLGIAEEFETFVSTLRSKSPMHLDRIDPAFLTLITFCINVQRALSLYFLARSLWIASEYGVAIAALDEATIAMRVRTSPEKRGLPEMEEKGPLSALVGEVNGFRLHMSTLMKSWERDNLLVYFDKVSKREWVGCVVLFVMPNAKISVILCLRISCIIYPTIHPSIHAMQVPPSVPSEKALKAIQLKKAEQYILEMRDPLPLGVVVESPSKVAANNISSGVEGTTPIASSMPRTTSTSAHPADRFSK